MNEIYNQELGIVIRVKQFNEYEKPIELFFDTNESIGNKKSNQWSKIREGLKEIAEKETENIASTVTMLINNITQMYLQRGVGFLDTYILEYKTNMIRYISEKLNINPYDYEYKPTTSLYNEAKYDYENYNESLKEIIKDINILFLKKNDILEDKENKFLKYSIKESDLYKQNDSPIYYKKDLSTGEKYSFLGYLSRDFSDDQASIDKKIKTIKTNNNNLKDIYKINKNSWSSYSQKDNNLNIWEDKQLEFLNKYGVEFIIYDMYSGEEIHFENTITSLTDSISINRDERKISGRPDVYRIYSATSRSSNLNFSIPSSSKEGLITNMEKIRLLKMICKPNFINNRPVNPFLRITIGNFLKYQIIKINSLIINPDEEMGWKIRKDDDEMSFPYKLDITIDFTIIYENTPNYNNNFKYFNN